MKKFIKTEDAIKDCNNADTLIPSEFLSTFPNYFGINLCAIKGFEIEMTDDNQYKSIKVEFIPVEKRKFKEDNSIE